MGWRDVEEKYLFGGLDELKDYDDLIDFLYNAPCEYVKRMIGKYEQFELLDMSTDGNYQCRELKHLLADECVYMGINEKNIDKWRKTWLADTIKKVNIEGKKVDEFWAKEKRSL